MLPDAFLPSRFKARRQARRELQQRLIQSLSSLLPVLETLDELFLNPKELIQSGGTAPLQEEELKDLQASDRWAPRAVLVLGRALQSIYGSQQQAQSSSAKPSRELKALQQALECWWRCLSLEDLVGAQGRDNVQDVFIPEALLSEVAHGSESSQLHERIGLLLQDLSNKPLDFRWKRLQICYLVGRALVAAHGIEPLPPSLEQGLISARIASQNAFDKALELARSHNASKLAYELESLFKQWQDKVYIGGMSA